MHTVYLTGPVVSIHQLCSAFECHVLTFMQKAVVKQGSEL